MYTYHTYTSPRRTLVTGGAGFIGSHLCERLLYDGHEVVCLDNFFTGTRENIAHLIGRPGFEIIRHDITQPILLEVDWIFNLACPASPIHYQYNPVKTIKVNVLGTLNVLGLAKRVRARIFQASTSEIYGDPETHPQVETYWGNVNPIGKRSCYDEGKRVAETIYGDGSQTRSFTYVDDMVEGIIRMMDHQAESWKRPDDYTEPTLSGFPGPVNLGNPRETSILDIARTVIRLTGSSSPIVHRDLPEDDPKQRCPDISLARKALEWEPTTGLTEGLVRTIEHFRKAAT